MNVSISPRQAPTQRPTSIAGRYRVDGVLGQGGMAVVYRVHDETNGQQFALKQLVPGHDRTRDKITRLFQQEFQTLTHLAHPRIVSVYEYGVDSDERPYYTMELLDGADLSPPLDLDWRTACVVLRDVASALAVVHSRKFVHRDITVRNVRLTLDGRAKLIDFGALAPLGAPATIVGTPPHVAPEALHGQPLDARTDLYALGALAYIVLTGRHAYPARRLEQLRERWRTEPAAPSMLVPELPPALSALVMSLLSLDPVGRPTTAWEVIDRLSAIAGLAEDAERGSARAYLVTPALVGRDREMQTARTQLVAATRGRGTSLWVHGPSGSGRSRLLGSIALEARMLGMTVARANGAEGHKGDFAVLRVLLRELLAARPSLRKNLLCEAETLLRSEDEVVSPAEQAALLAHGRAALARWLLGLSQHRGLVIAVDDVHLADRASGALLRELTQAGSRHRIAVVLSVSSDGGPAAAQWSAMLGHTAAPIELQPLNEAETESLMVSVFGTAAHLKALAHVVHKLSQGNPGTCMGLTQQLLDCEAVRYESGRWVLPSDPRTLGLSGNLRDALRVRLGTLSPEALELAQALALIDPLAPIATEHYANLQAPAATRDVFFQLRELVLAGVLNAHGDSYALSHPALAKALCEDLGPARRRDLNLRLARVYAMAPYSDEFMQGWHLQQAGEHDAAAKLLVERARLLAAPNPTVLVGRPVRHALAARAYLSALNHSEHNGAASREIFDLRRAILNLATYYDPSMTRYGQPLIRQLVRDTGLCYAEEFSGVSDPGTRTWQCLARAKECYDAAPEAERGLEPGEAVRVLVSVVMAHVGGYSRTLDLDGLAGLSPLIEPFRAIAPTLDVFADILQLSIDGLRGHDTAARTARIVARIEDDAKLREDRFMQMSASLLRYYIGAWHARNGGRRGLEYADEIERRNKDWEALYPTSVGLGRFRAWHVRLLSYLYNGDNRRAQQCRERIELLQLDGLDQLVTPNVRTTAYLEAHAYVLSGSLLELRHSVDAIAELAVDCASWTPVLCWVRGEYHKARTDYAAARDELVAAVDQTGPGRHLIYSWAAGALAEVDLLSGNVEVARDHADAAMRACIALGYPCMSLSELGRVLALAEAQLGDHTGAAQRLDALLAVAELELGGVPLGRLHEARARVALFAGDASAFKKHARATAELFRPGRNPVLVTRYNQLLDDADRLGLRRRSSRRAAAPPSIQPEEVLASAVLTIKTMMEACPQPQRGVRALQLIMEHSGAEHGYLFGVQAEALVPIAALGPEPVPEELLLRLHQLADRDRDDVTRVLAAGTEQGPSDGRITLATGTAYHPLWLRGSHADSPHLAGVAALNCAEGTPRPIPWRLLGAISDYLIDATEISAMALSRDAVEPIR